MPRSADLFVVCKQCGSEVSPYITECPYCGARLRRRAPKLPRVKARESRLSRGWARLRALTGRSPDPVRDRERVARRAGLRGYGDAPGGRRRASRRRASRGRRHGWSGESPPYATIALVTAGCAGWVAVRGDYVGFEKFAIIGPLHGDWWKLLSSSFAYIDGLYAFIALLATAIFGWLLERRHGPALVLVVFFGGAVTGALAASAAYAEPVVSGANGGALALIGAWAAPDLLAARRSSYYEGDLLGAGVIAATLLLVPYARPEASWLAGAVGGVVGMLLGAGAYLIASPEP
jgi:membrane associated rhomboid family serine protease